MGKGGRCVRLTTLPLSCAVVMKSGKLNFLEPSGPLQACNGTALPLPLKYIYVAHPFLTKVRMVTIDNQSRQSSIFVIYSFKRHVSAQKEAIFSVMGH